MTREWIHRLVEWPGSNHSATWYTSREWTLLELWVHSDWRCEQECYSSQCGCLHSTFWIATGQLNTTTLAITLTMMTHHTLIFIPIYFDLCMRTGHIRPTLPTYHIQIQGLALDIHFLYTKMANNQLANINLRTQLHLHSGSPTHLRS